MARNYKNYSDDELNEIVDSDDLYGKIFIDLSDEDLYNFYEYEKIFIPYSDYNEEKYCDSFQEVSRRIRNKKIELRKNRIKKIETLWQEQKL